MPVQSCLRYKERSANKEGEYELSSFLDRHIVISQNLQGVGDCSEEDKLNYFLTRMACTSLSLDHAFLVLVEVSFLFGVPAMFCK